MTGRFWFFFAVSLPLVGCAKPPDLMEVLKKNQDTMIALKAYNANCLTDISFDPPRSMHRYELSTLFAEKPLRMRYDAWEVKSLPTGKVERPTTKPEITFACAGDDLYTQFGDVYRVKKGVSPEFMTTIQEPWDGFYSAMASLSNRAAAGKKAGALELNYDGTEDVDGVSCDKVKFHSIDDYEGRKVEETATYFIGRDDHLVRREVAHVSFDGKPGFTRTATLRDIDFSPTKQPAIFVYKPPPGVTNEDNMKRPALLAAGTKAPEFTVSDAEKKPIKLSSLKGKVVVVDFWASWCGPCRQSMPHTQDVAKKMADAGLPVVVLAIDDGEPRQGFDAWVSENRSTFPNMRFAYGDPKDGISSKLYQVSGIPTQYIIDKKGIVRANFVGYRGPTDDLENAIRAALNLNSDLRVLQVRVQNRR